MRWARSAAIAAASRPDALAGGERLAALGVPGHPVLDLAGRADARAGGGERHEGRGDVAGGRHHRRHRAFDLGEQALGRAEVGDQRRRRVAGEGRVDEALVGREARSAPAVDRLLGVADQEETGAFVRRALEREARDQLALQVVGVLQLVDQELADAAPRVARDPRPGEQIDRQAEQVGVGRAAPRAHPPLDLGGERAEQLASGVEQLGVDPLEQPEGRTQAPGGGRHRRRRLAQVLALPLVEGALRSSRRRACARRRARACRARRRAPRRRRGCAPSHAAPGRARQRARRPARSSWRCPRSERR